MKRVLSFVLSLVITLGVITGMDVSVFAATSNTTIEISDSSVEHMVGSTFSISASYKSDTYSHNSETISYKIIGDATGLIVDGNLSCLGTKEKGIIALPLKGIKIGEYEVVLCGPDGATDSIKIIISEKTYDVYLAENILYRDKFLSSTDTIIQLSDYGWMQSNEVMLYFNDMSVQQYVETMLIRILIGKVIDEKNIYESYAEAASLVTKCMSGIQSIYSSVTEETTFDTINDIEIKNQIKTYINDMYKFDVFDTLSTTINGATTISTAVKQASYYRVVSDVLSVEELSNMLSVTAETFYSSEYENTLWLAFTQVSEIITNTDLKISEYFANTAISYGFDSLKSLTLDIAQALALNSLNAVAPGLGTVLSAGMTVYEICKAIDDLCQSKLEAVQINLSALSMFCNAFKHSIEFRKDNPKEYAEIIVENYKYLLSANKIAVEIQQENIDILSKNLLESVSVQPAFSLKQLLNNIDILGGESDCLYSTYLVTERYPVVLDTLNSIINNEYDYIKTVTEDYLYYSYGMDLFKYTSDLWEIETKYVVTLDSNFEDSSFSNKQYYYFSKGETLDERTCPHLRSGYEFVGWYTDKECTIEYNFDNAIENNFTLYAKWEKKINYVENEDGTATVTSINSRQSRNSTMQLFSLTRTIENPTQTTLEQIQAAEAIVPLFIDGKSIVSIASNAISSDCSSVYIPEIVENIENDAIAKSTCIICWPNSYSHRYARDNGYDYVLLNFDGTDENASETFTYVVNNDGYTATITGLVDNCNPTNLYIPLRINGYSVTSISDSAFEDCENLSSIIIPDSVISIGDDAFYDCTKLSTVTIPENVTSIGRDAFDACYNLKAVYITDVASWCNIDFYEDEYNYSSNPLRFADYLYINGELATDVVIPNGVTSIPQYAFSCDNITSVIIPDSVITIEDYSFYACDSLESVIIDDNLISIGREVFSYCASLTSIIIPDSVNSIGEKAFYATEYYNNDDNWENGVLYIGNHLIAANKYEVREGYTANVSGDYVIKDGTKTISDRAFYNCTNLTSVTIPDSVVSIGEYAFCACNELSSVIIPDSVSSIGDSAFRSCDSLTSITIPNSVICIGAGAFSWCDNLSSIVMGNSVRSIGSEAFYGCDSLTSIKIPNSVTSIGSYAFYHCNNLTSIIIPDSVATIGSKAFCGTEYYENPDNWEDGVLYISNHLIAADEYNTVREEYSGSNVSGAYVIKDGTKTIANQAFYNCTSLTSVTIPDSVTSIGSYAFYECNSLTSVTIPDSVTNIGSYAFYDCDSLTSINIGAGVTSIGTYTFGNCQKLRDITLPSSITNIGFAAFGYCYGLKSITIPKSVTSIGDNAFCYCIKLPSVIIGSGVTSIGASAFKCCDSLTSVTIPDSVTNIGSYAFYDCDSLTSITIPDSVTNIGSCAFGYYRDSSTYEETPKNNFIISGKSGTYSECYAKENGFVFKVVCDHATSNWITDTEATVYAAGEKYKECTECGEVLETATIKQLKCSKPKLSKIENTSSGVKITWGKVSGADKYYVYRKTGSSGKYSKIATTSKTYYTDKKASSGKKYYYYVKAVNEAGSSSASSSKSIYYLADPTLKTPKSTKKGITLNWSKVKGADGYVIYYKTGSGSYKKLTTVKGSSKVTYTHTKAKKGKTYSYKVKAYKSKTYSAYSNAKKIKDKY